MAAAKVNYKHRKRQAWSQIEMPTVSDEAMGPLGKKGIAATQAANVTILQGVQPSTGLDLSSEQKAAKSTSRDGKTTRSTGQTTWWIQGSSLPLLHRPRIREDLQQLRSHTREQAQPKPFHIRIRQVWIGERNETYERYIFNSRAQKDGESVDKYVAELRKLAQTSSFCTCLQDSLMRDRIFLGIRDARACPKTFASTTQVELTKVHWYLPKSRSFEPADQDYGQQNASRWRSQSQNE